MAIPTAIILGQTTAETSNAADKALILTDQIVLTIATEIEIITNAAMTIKTENETTIITVKTLEIIITPTRGTTTIQDSTCLEKTVTAVGDAVEAVLEVADTAEGAAGVIIRVGTAVTSLGSRLVAVEEFGIKKLEIWFRFFYICSIETCAH